MIFGRIWDTYDYITHAAHPVNSTLINLDLEIYQNVDALDMLFQYELFLLARLYVKCSRSFVIKALVSLMTAEPSFGMTITKIITPHDLCLHDMGQLHCTDT